MDIPPPTIPFERVSAEVPAGKTFWAMRGEPERNSRVEVFYASLFQDEDELVPGIDYVGGYWTDQSGGEEDWFELDEAAAEFDLNDLAWHEALGSFHPGYTPEYTVEKLIAA